MATSFFSSLTAGQTLSFALTFLVLVVAMAAYAFNRMAFYRLPRGQFSWVMASMKLGDHGCKAVAKSLKANKEYRTLGQLNLADNNIGPDGAHALAKAIEDTNIFLDLVLKDNNLGDVGAIHLSNLLKKYFVGSFERMRDRPASEKEKRGTGEAKHSEGDDDVKVSGASWDLSNCKIGSLGIESLFKAVFNVKTIKGGDKNKLNSSAPSMRRLRLAANPLGDEGCRYVAKVIGNRPEGTKIHSLCLAGTDIGEKGSKKLIETIGMFGGVSELDISDNPNAKDAPLYALASCIISNGHRLCLHHLSLCNIGASEKGVQKLAEALQRQPFHNIEELKLDGNNLSRRSLTVLNDALTEKARMSGAEVLNRAKEEKDPQKVTALYMIAAYDKGYIPAYCLLAEAYQNGLGVQKDQKRAVELYIKAAEANDKTALSCLADCYLSGDGVEQDLNKASQLFRRAAQSNEPNATYNLGMCYMKGIGECEPNQKKAFVLIRTAAELGQPIAQRLCKKLWPERYKDY